MHNKTFLSLMAIVTLMLLPSVTFAADQCQSDSDCADGTLCFLAMNPPVCKPPQPTGGKCRRDEVCASHKCDIPEGQQSGKCE